MTNNSIYEKNLNLDSFGRNWGWNRSGSMNNWSNLVIKQSNKQQIFVKQNSGNKVWKESESGKKIKSLSNNKLEKEDNTFFISSKDDHRIAWHPITLWIGIGCERNTSAKFIEDCINKLLLKYELSSSSIAGLATVDIKKNEKALIEITNAKNWPIKFFNNEELHSVDVPNPSKIVFKEIGTSSVAEAASLLACGNEGGDLLVEKNIFKHKDPSGRNLGAVTIAIAESKKQFAPDRGFVHVIGSGPGDLSYLTSESKAALSQCSVWIGYKMYLDLLNPLMRDDQVRINSELTQEKQRCLDAISLAQQGIKVALISSGDAGIYGMAGLLIELIQKLDFQFRPSFAIHPGISSLQLAASIAGAPLMNDFCAISLSDKLTPWEIIKRRINGALVGDFVVVIFNPQSKERNWQLKTTIEMFLRYRAKTTPVLVARQVGRDQQKKRIFNLDSIPINEIDMLSIIIIGNSSTKLVNNFLISPRGYL